MGAQPSGLAPTAIDLFCGVGGLSLGLVQGGFRLLGAVDQDRHTLETHTSNFPNTPTHCCDLYDASGEDVRATLGITGQPVDLLAGGPPCQGFSIGGRRAKKDPRNHGVLAFARLVAEIRPRYFLMENVRGFTFRDHAAIRRRFTATVSAVGYVVLPVRVLNAADYGVPQRRKRAFVLGCLQTEMPPEYPEAAAAPPPTVLDAIGDLAVIDKSQRPVDEDAFRGVLGEPSGYAQRLRGRSRSKMTTLTGCQRSRHSEQVVERFKATPPGGREAISRFFRLAWAGVSPTIRAGTDETHGNHTAPRPIHPEWPRCITVREAARLHSFPDWFAFRGNRWAGFRQIGNSVPPLLAEAVAAKIREVCAPRPLRATREAR
jgi:DNA (cytosine-5)-methyltransferase 1